MLLESSASAVVAAVPLEVSDDPCVVLMSATGLVARVAVGDQEIYAERTVVPPAGDLAVSPSAGSLSAGQSVTVSVTVSSTTGLASETDLAVSPGGLMVAVLYTG